MLFKHTSLLYAAAAVLAVLGNAQDTHDSCSYWADMGECESNPGYMLVGCKTSCDRVKAALEVRYIYRAYMYGMDIGQAWLL
jgi:hypothetical protein